MKLDAVDPQTPGSEIGRGRCCTSAVVGGETGSVTVQGGPETGTLMTSHSYPQNVRTG